jgi:hypothetical protein
MYVVNYLQDEETEEMQNPALGRREFKLWNAKDYSGEYIYIKKKNSMV